MKLFTLLAVFLYFSFFPIFNLNSAERQLAEELYVQSGLQKQMSDIVLALLAGYKHNYDRMARHTDRDKVFHQRIEKVLKSSFDQQAMRKLVVDALEKQMSKNDAEEVLHWLGSSIGKKCTALEERASSQDGIEEGEQFLKNIKTRKFPEGRIHLIKELTVSMDIVETTVEMTLASQFALSMTTRQTKAELSTDKIEQLYNDFKINRSRIEQAIKYQVYGSLLYTYQSLSDAELKEYVSFARSESGQNYTRITSSSIIKAITNSSLQFARAISRL